MKRFREEFWNTLTPQEKLESVVIVWITLLFTLALIVAALINLL